MNTNTIVVGLAAAIIFGAAGYWGGATFGSGNPRGGAAGNLPGGGSAYQMKNGGAGGRFVSGAGVSGQIISAGNGTFTVQLASATTSGAASGTKIVLFDSSTQIDETQRVSSSALKTGANVVVRGTPNSDGSVTAQAVQIVPAGFGTGSANVRIGG